MWNLFSRNFVAPVSDPPLVDRARAPEQHEIAQVDYIGSTAIATVTVGELCSQRGAVVLADLLDQIVDAGAENIVLDISNVTFMDSACVGCMVEALNRLSACGGRIALVNPASSVAHIFRLTRLDRVFPILPDVLAAMKVIERKT